MPSKDTECTAFNSLPFMCKVIHKVPFISQLNQHMQFIHYADRRNLRKVLGFYTMVKQRLLIDGRDLKNFNTRAYLNSFAALTISASVKTKLCSPSISIRYLVGNLNELWLMMEDTRWAYEIQPYTLEEETCTNAATIRGERCCPACSQSRGATIP